MKVDEIAAVLDKHLAEDHYATTNPGVCTSLCRQKLIVRASEFRRDQIARELEALFKKECPAAWQRLAGPWIDKVAAILWPEGVPE